MTGHSNNYYLYPQVLWPTKAVVSLKALHPHVLPMKTSIITLITVYCILVIYSQASVFLSLAAIIIIAVAAINNNFSLNVLKTIMFYNDKKPKQILINQNERFFKLTIILTIFTRLWIGKSGRPREASSVECNAWANEATWASLGQDDREKW